jgi:sugar/nucleoside kinase (ribokinase family)
MTQQASDGTPEVLVCGTLVADVRVRPFRALRPGRGPSLRRVDDIRLLPGGVVANMGLALARLGIATSAIGRLGCDPMGDVVLATLQRGDMDTRGIRRMRDVPTAPVIVCIDEQGERTFHYAEGANTLFDRDDLLDNLRALRAARAITLGYLGELPRLDPHLPEVLAWLKRESGALIVLETAGPQVEQRNLLASRLPLVDVFVPSWDEAREVTGARTPEAALRYLAAIAPHAVLGIKLGARGCLVRDNGSMHHVPAFPVTAIDATGAGDAFLAGFLAGLLRGCDPRAAARLGNLAGALTVAAPSGEGQAAVPAYDELMALAVRGASVPGLISPAHAPAATGGPA